jgi:hypothetical protein
VHLQKKHEIDKYFLNNKHLHFYIILRYDLLSRRKDIHYVFDNKVAKKLFGRKIIVPRKKQRKLDKEELLSYNVL